MIEKEDVLFAKQNRLEKRLDSLEKRFWLVLFLIFASFGYDAKSLASNLITGATALEVNTMVSPTLLLGLAGAAGATFRSWLGWLKKKDKIEWDWYMFLISFMPAVALAFGTSAGFDLPASATNLLMIFFGAAGLGSLQDKFGLQKGK